MALDIVLVADNTRRFERVEGLRIENWTRPELSVCPQAVDNPREVVNASFE